MLPLMQLSWGYFFHLYAGAFHVYFSYSSRAIFSPTMMGGDGIVVCLFFPELLDHFFLN